LSLAEFSDGIPVVQISQKIARKRCFAQSPTW